RLLISDEDADGQPVIRLAHEALLNRWPTAREIASTNRKFLEIRARLQTDARRWLLDNKNPDLLLPQGVRLAEGEEFWRSRRDEADTQVSAFIDASSLAQRARVERAREE